MFDPIGIATTSFEMVEVDLEQYTIPDCPDCGEKMYLEEVGIVANPTKAFMVPTWNLLKPVCGACGKVFLDHWDAPWMLYRGPNEKTGLIAVEKGEVSDKP